jgi:hypothetical protein
MKTIITFLLPLAILCSQGLNAQGKTYVCETGKIHFFASTAVSDIEATSNTGGCTLNTQTKKISAKVAMQSFVFKLKKMQDDFNEDYAESTKFPDARLEAVIVSNVNFTKDGTYNVTLKGTFEMHGVKTDKVIQGKLTIKNGQPVNATAQFDVKLVDHKIKVPTIVVVKIAEVVKVDVNFAFTKLQL